MLERLCFCERLGEVVNNHSGFASEGWDREAELSEINRYTLRSLTEDEYVVFTLDLCHNQIDRHFSCFPENELEVIDKKVPGRPLMERHDLRGSLPRGTFFYSRLHRQGDVLSVRPKVYVLRLEENRNFIANIEGGIYRETSIGFSFLFPECSICGRDIRRCVHVPGEKYEGSLCFYRMRGVQDVLEGSVVACGSQGTSFVSDVRAHILEQFGEKGGILLQRSYFGGMDKNKAWCKE
ncbi:MAG: hypothetical protein ACP5QY_12035 [Candidatus Hydrogenedens sp.]